MAFADLGSLGATGSTANNQATLVLTTTLTASVGNLAVVVIADDNDGAGADGDGAEVTGVQNSGTANEWKKAVGWSNNQGATQAGAAVQIWYSIVTTQITSGATITATFATATLSDATAITGRVFSVAAGMQPAIIATNGKSDTSVDPSALDAATPNVAALRIRGIAGQIGTSTALTPTASWTAWAAGNSAVTGTTGEMCARAESIISTGTGGSSNPTWVSAIHASGYVAFVERDYRWGWEGQGAQFVTQQPPPGGSNKSRAVAGAFAGPIYPADIYVGTPPIIYGFDSQDDFFPQGRQATRAKASALRQKVGFAVSGTFIPMGWEVQSPQPPHPRRERFASIHFKGQDAFPTPILLIGDYAWFETPWVYPRRKFFVGDGAYYKGQDAPPPSLQFLSTADFSWMETHWVHQKPRFNPGGIKSKSQFAVPSTWYNFGWEIQSVQPPHLRREKFGSLASKDDGIHLPFIPPSVITWEEKPWVFPRKNFAKWASISPKSDGTERPYATWFNYGWDVQSVQPPQTKQKKSGAIARKLDGTASFVQWRNAGWEIQSPQPPKPKPERGIAFWKGDDGIEFPYISAALTVDFKWTESPWVYPRKHFARWAAIAPRDDGNEGKFEYWCNAGWEIQSLQPPRRHHEKWPLADWDDGNYSVFAIWRNFGWEFQHVQPPHQWIEKRGAIMPREDGTENIKPFGLQTGDYSWAQTPWLYPRVRYERASAVMPKSDGIERPFSQWFNYGWELQPVQPPHRRPEKFGTLALGDNGIEFPFVPPVPFAAWQFDPPWIPLRNINIGAIFADGDKGNQGTYKFWRNAGWEVQPTQPPRRKFERWAALARGQDGIPIAALLTAAYPWHDEPFVYPRRKPERWGSLARGDDGNHARFERFVNLGWPVQPWQPPRRRHELRGAIAPRDDGTQYPLLRFFNYGWPIQPWQPPHPKYLHQYIQDIGSYPFNLFHFIPPPPIIPPRRRSKRLVSLFFQDERNVEVSDVRTNLQNPNIRRREDTDPSR